MRLRKVSNGYIVTVDMYEWVDDDSEQVTAVFTTLDEAIDYIRNKMGNV